MRIRAVLLLCAAVGWLWPTVPTLAADDTLAQIEAMVRGYKQKSFGPFAGYAGVYDDLKSCKRLPTPDVLLGSVWLQTKWVTWFEGDDIIFIQLLVPDHLVRGRLKFKRDFELRKGGTIKLYDVTWASGATEIDAFLSDRMLFAGEVEGNNFTYKYALRCTNEDQLIDWAREILPLIGK